ncbi:hypothetical protein BDV95DRAFT_225631 [Massariosphaeria phaeospora]|uniref:Uncharacterized protein n=1 Tax=Massariosphaeria phaeospora TaxID=100035 RepID=A0A7C8ICT4_9PLEO|nr:hypothetical protein BDV95DRAFT_225631 [Massariosphaeria phaeospora]
MGTESLHPVRQSALHPATASSRSSPETLPSIAELVSSPLSPPAFVPVDRMSHSWRATVSGPSAERPVYRSTPLSVTDMNSQSHAPAPPRRPSSWTAVNRHPMQNSSHAQSPSYGSPENGCGRQTAQELRIHQYSPPQPTKSLHRRVRSSDPGRFPDREQPTASDPMGSDCQDFAIADSRRVPRWKKSQMPVKSMPGAFPASLSGAHEPDPLIPVTEASYATPPSPAPSPVASTASEVPSMNAVIPPSGRHTGYSATIPTEAQNSPGMAPTTNTHADADTLPNSPQRARSVRFVAQSASIAMPPPQPPASNSSACYSNDRLGSHDNTASPSSTAPQQSAVESFRQPNSDQTQSTMSSNETVGASNGASSSAPSRGGSRPPLRCRRCGAVWASALPEFPPPEQPSATFQEYNIGQESILAQLRNYRERNESVLQELETWIQSHVVDEATYLPSNNPHTDVQDCTSLAIKRKSGTPIDDANISTKLRKITFDSPSPKLCEYTPPPEQPMLYLAADPSTFADDKKRFRLPSEVSGENIVHVTESIASMLHLPGARPHPRQNPPQNSYNMWYDPHSQDSTDGQT